MGWRAVIHHRLETTPPHGDPIRLDVRRRADAPPESAVLVVHGFKGFKDWGFFPHLCERIAEAGHLAISFNGSLNGVGPDLQSFTDLDAFGRNTFSRELADVAWMLDQLGAGAWSDGSPPTSVGLLGHSRGGGIAIISASERRDVAALVTWSAVATFERWTALQLEQWEQAGVTYIKNARTGQDMPLFRSLHDDQIENRDRLDVLRAASRITAPWLIVHGSDDPVVPVGEAVRLRDAGGDTSLEEIPTTGHTFDAGHPMERPPGKLSTAIDATLQHFRCLQDEGRRLR